MNYIGDFTQNKIISYKFNTSNTSGAPITLTGSPAPALSVYKGTDLVGTNSGVSLTVNFNSITGYHNISVDTSVNTSFYATGTNYSVVIATGTVDSISVVGKEIFNFSISNRNIDSNLISITGNSSISIFNSSTGVINANVASITGSVGSVVGNVGGSVVGNISGTVGNVTGTVNANVVSVTGNTNISVFDSSTDPVLVTSITGSVGSVVGNVGGSVASVTNPVTVTSITGSVGSVVGTVTATVSSITGSVGSVAGNVAGSVASVTNPVTVTSITGSVGSVTGNVAGNILGTVAGVTGTVSANLVAISGVPQSAWDLKKVIDNVESGYNLQQTLRLILSSVAAKLSGADGNTIYFRDINDTKNRMVATVTTSGNRTSISYDVS